MNPIALATGANKGLRQLARDHDCLVLLGCRDEAKGYAAEAELRAEGLQAQFLLLDVTRENQIQQAVRDVEGRFGRLDVSVNNVGVMIEHTPEVASVSLDV